MGDRVTPVEDYRVTALPGRTSACERSRQAMGARAQVLENQAWIVGHWVPGKYWPSDDRVVVMKERYAVVGIVSTSLLLSACLVGSLLAVSPGPAASAATQSAYRIADVSLVQLRVPSPWQFQLGSPICLPHRSLCHRPCLPGPNESIDIALVPPAKCQGPSDASHNSVWIARIATVPGAPTVRRQIRSGEEGVEVTMPSLGVVLYGFGATGEKVANDAIPSPLARLLLAKLPSARPGGWKRVAWEHLAVSVPPRWPVIDLSHNRAVNPGTCAAPPFPRPVADLGSSDIVLFCPLITWNFVWTSSSTPGNGVWLVGTARSSANNGPQNVVSRTVGTLHVSVHWPVALSGSGSVDFDVSVGGHSVEGLLGLGSNTETAIQILRSLRHS